MPSRSARLVGCWLSGNWFAGKPLSDESLVPIALRPVGNPPPF